MDISLPGLFAAPNIHPLFVHFPIALLIVALLFQLLALAVKSDDYLRTGRWLLYLGTLGAVVAAATGFIATQEMGRDTAGHDLVHVHRDFMLVTSGLAVLTSIVTLASSRSRSSTTRWVQMLLLAATVVVLTVGADRGAELVFRYGMGTAGQARPATLDRHDGHNENEGHGSDNSGHHGERHGGERHGGERHGGERHGGERHGGEGHRGHRH